MIAFIEVFGGRPSHTLADRRATRAGATDPGRDLNFIESTRGKRATRLSGRAHLASRVGGNPSDGRTNLEVALDCNGVRNAPNGVRLKLQRSGGCPVSRGPVVDWRQRTHRYALVVVSELLVGDRPALKFQSAARTLPADCHLGASSTGQRAFPKDPNRRPPLISPVHECSSDTLLECVHGDSGGRVMRCGRRFFFNVVGPIARLNFGLTSRHQPGSDPRRQCPEWHPWMGLPHGRNHEVCRVQSVGILVQACGKTGERSK